MEHNRREPSPVHRLTPQEKQEKTNRELDEQLKRLRERIAYMRLKNAQDNQVNEQNVQPFDPKQLQANDTKDPDELVRGPDGEWVNKNYLN